MNPNPPARPDESRPVELNSAILGLAFAIGIPLYVLIAWILQRTGAGHPELLGGDRRMAVYAALAFVGLGSAAASFLVRKAIAGQSDQRRFPALVVGLALAEVPALTGLVYFVVSYDWPGFLLLLGATVVCFVLHARRA